MAHHRLAAEYQIGNREGKLHVPALGHSCSRLDKAAPFAQVGNKSVYFIKANAKYGRRCERYPWSPFVALREILPSPERFCGGFVRTSTVENFGSLSTAALIFLALFDPGRYGMAAIGVSQAGIKG